MNQEQLTQLTDSELEEYYKNFKPSPLVDAFIIGFLVGIVIFGFAVSTWGFFLLVPLYLIHLFLKKPKKYEALQRELKERGLE